MHVFRGELELWEQSLRTLHEERDCRIAVGNLVCRYLGKRMEIRERQREDRKLVFALYMECSAARNKRLHLRTGQQHLLDQRRSARYLFKVIQDQQQVPVA